MININTIQHLLQEHPIDVFSLYLNTDNADRVNQAETPGWRIALKNALSAGSDSGYENWKQIEERVNEYMNGFNPQHKALVLFVTADVLHDYKLPLTVDNEWHFGQPLVAPLMWAIDEHEAHLLVRVDRESALLDIVSQGRNRNSESMQIDLDYDWGQRTLMPATGTNPNGGNNREAHEDMLDEHRRRFYRDIADQVMDLLRDEDHIDRIIIGGNEKAAKTVRDYLRDDIQNKVIGYVNVPLDARNDDILEHVQSLMTNHERSYEFELVDEVINMAKAGGRGAIGIEDVSKALTMQQVELLILPYTLDKSALSDFTMQALENGATVELVHGAAATKLDNAGSVAARLYYAITETA